MAPLRRTLRETWWLLVALTVEVVGLPFVGARTPSEEAYAFSKLPCSRTRSSSLRSSLR
jgi:hypothetical protein